MTNANTPIPPIKCVKPRQKSIALSKCSTSLNIVAPVVVNPDTVSNNASMYGAS